MNLLIRKLENHFPAYETNIAINLCPKNYLPDFAGICKDALKALRFL